MEDEWQKFVEAKIAEASMENNQKKQARVVWIL